MLLGPDGAPLLITQTTSDRIVLTDIHGRLDVFKRAVDSYPDRQFVILGDVIDRGPDSPGCMALTRELVLSGRAVLLLGNHEKMMMDSFFHPDDELRRQLFAIWHQNGGDKTIAQYVPDPAGPDVDAQFAVFLADMEFVAEHALDWFAEGDVLYAHAGRPTLENGQLPQEPLTDAHLWSRPADGIGPLPAGFKWSVHGHTPMKAPAFDEEIGVAYIDLGPSQLAALDTRDMSTFQFKNLEQRLVV